MFTLSKELRFHVKSNVCIACAKADILTHPFGQQNENLGGEKKNLSPFSVHIRIFYLFSLSVRSVICSFDGRATNSMQVNVQIYDANFLSKVIAWLANLALITCLPPSSTSTDNAIKL
ncbi:hypothetical protein T4D_1598 [Trichinella pseudospiralis]|uniref:Uncharacterized protein n=1 Tax=Trichinella pseudospiralis TaxID=6337 RepID=A0A0V1FNP6_TRIPS|nr:hypothetical protein T4D_1598 [Trichinella pseudospiralis]